MDYFGFPTRSLENRYLRLDYLTTIGPRLVRLIPAGTETNLLAETPDVGWDTPFGPYRLRGGHRLWAAPQDDVRTAIPDNGPIQVEELADGTRLIQPPEIHTGLSKTIEVRLHPQQAALTLTHTLTNTSIAPLELAPWAITQLPHGGRHIIPQQDPRPDLGRNQPNRMLALWSYAHWDDPRLKIGQDFLTVKAMPGKTEFKIGTANRTGWSAYGWKDFVFCKRFTPSAGPYPDGGANTEIFVNDVFTELETLGHLVRLAPGESAALIEEWEIYQKPDLPAFLPTIQDW